MLKNIIRVDFFLKNKFDKLEWFGGVKQNIFLIYLFEMLDNECLKTTAVWHTLSFVYKQGAQTQTTAIDRSHPLSSWSFIHTHLINDSQLSTESVCWKSFSPVLVSRKSRSRVQWSDNI